jgi:hypothetical protein
VHPVIRDLREQSTWRLLGLSILTYDVYAAFYARRQTIRLNEHLEVSERIPPVLPNVVLVVNVLNLALRLPAHFVEEGHPLRTVSDCVGLAANLGLVVWGFVARNRVNRLLAAQRGQPSWFSGLWTFLFSPLYFNYKVNVLADLDAEQLAV